MMLARNWVLVQNKMDATIVCVDRTWDRPLVCETRYKKRLKKILHGFVFVYKLFL